MTKQSLWETEGISAGGYCLVVKDQHPHLTDVNHKVEICARLILGQFYPTEFDAQHQSILLRTRPVSSTYSIDELPILERERRGYHSIINTSGVQIFHH